MMIGQGTNAIGDAVAEGDQQADQNTQADDGKEPLRRLQLEVGLLQIVRELARMRGTREQRVEAVGEPVKQVP